MLITEFPSKAELFKLICVKTLIRNLILERFHIVTDNFRERVNAILIASSMQKTITFCVELRHCLVKKKMYRY